MTLETIEKLKLIHNNKTHQPSSHGSRGLDRNPGECLSLLENFEKLTFGVQNLGTDCEEADANGLHQ